MTHFLAPLYLVFIWQPATKAFLFRVSAKKNYYFALFKSNEKKSLFEDVALGCETDV